MKTTFIYALCEPGTRTVRYIGMTGVPKRRLREHLRKARNRSNHRECWLFSLVSNGLKPEMVILREVSKSDWKMAEERYIRLARGCGMNLTNGTDGGDGKLEASPGTIKKMSECKLGPKNPMFGKPAHNKGKPSPSKGVPRTPETRAKISAAKIGVPLSPEHRANLSAATLGEKHHMFGKTLPPEICAKHSAVKTGANNPMFGKTQTKESNAKRSAALSGEKNHNFGKAWTPEIREAIRVTKARTKERAREIEWALAPYTLT